MRTESAVGAATATKIEGHRRQDHFGSDIGVPFAFAAVAKALWPRKTAACLASIAGKDERTAKRWLSGEYDAPSIIVAAIIIKITKRD